MAIHCMNPNTLGQHTSELYSIITNTGGELVNNFAETIEKLKLHWSGSDAVANLESLLKVYTAVSGVVDSLQKFIVKINNNEVIPLQKHINVSGGTCTVASELSEVKVTTGEVEIGSVDSVVSYTSPEIITDAEEFSNFPKKFENFVSSLDESMNVLLSNWLDGANRDEVVNAYNSFKENVEYYKEYLNTVRNNLNVVSSNKKQFF